MRRAALVVVLTCACGGNPPTADEDFVRDSAPVDVAVDAHEDALVVEADTSVVTDTAPPEKRGPPYPIVLAHGFFGFEDFAGAGYINYFYGVRADLAKDGETSVYTPAVDPFNSSEYRGKQLAAHVEQVLAETGAA